MQLLIESIAGKESQISGHSLADFFPTPTVKNMTLAWGFRTLLLYRICALGRIRLTMEAWTVLGAWAKVEHSKCFHSVLH
jgi:hypothetical protein